MAVRLTLCSPQVLKTDKDKEEAKNEEEMAEMFERHAKELQDLGTYRQSQCDNRSSHLVW